MNNREFKKLALSRGLMFDTPTYHACRLVLVMGFSASDAARVHGIHASSVTRPLKKLAADIPKCATCGQLIR